MNYSTKNLMSHEYSFIEQANIYVDLVCTPIILFNGVCIVSLSLIWTFYLILQLLKDHQVLKKTRKSHQLFSEQHLNCIENNANIRRKKYLFFLAICLVSMRFSFQLYWK